MPSQVDESPGLQTASPTIDVRMEHSTNYRTPPQHEEPEFNEKIDNTHLAPIQGPMSPGDTREQTHRFHDDLELLRVERLVSREEHQSRAAAHSRISGEHSRHAHHEEPQDAFNTVAHAPVVHHEVKSTPLTRLWKRLNKFPKALRYVAYAAPVAIILLAPILVDRFAYADSTIPVGGTNGVELVWFGIWLEVVWLTLWAARLVTAMMPFLFQGIATIVGSMTPKKWKDVGRSLEIHTALFLWQLAVIASFLPIVNSHRVLQPGIDLSNGLPYIKWIDVVNKIIIALFILATLNFIEKILIQWIATSFHQRTYSSRITQNRMETDFLVRLYEYAKTKLEEKDPVWNPNGYDTSGTRTPLGAMLHRNARQALDRVGSVANRMAGDFTGKKVLKGNHPRKVVLELLRNTQSSHTLARVFYRTFVRPGRDTITQDDLEPAFASPEDAETCFGVFDKDLNGDISMEELEMACNEIHLEKKAIAASLKDLDSVIKKLDSVFVFVIFVIAVVVFISILSNSAAAALTSAGTVVLGLSWLLQATAQEFLQSIIFVFVKHPFDVGDRVTVYGNTGNMMRGDDYYVQEISLLYTEFKKMEGHTVQAPNSLLNTLFILNQRRSTGLADPVELKLRFGTSNELIEELKARMLGFVLANKRDYAPKILTEVKTIDELYSITMNFIFFHKSSYQNELLRLQRHDRFAVELMRVIKELGIEGPRRQQPGASKDWPFHLTGLQPPAYAPHTAADHGGDGPLPSPVLSPNQHHATSLPHGQQPSTTRARSDSRALAAAAAAESGPHEFGDVYEGRKLDGHGVRRLSSLRSPTTIDEEGESAHTSALDRQASRESAAPSESAASRHRLWGRHRSRSNATGPPNPTAMV